MVGMRKRLAVLLALIAGFGAWWAYDPAQDPGTDPVADHDAESQGGQSPIANGPELQPPTESPKDTGRRNAALDEAPAPELVMAGRVLVVPRDGTASEAQPLAGALIAVGVADPKLEATSGADGSFRLTMFDRGDRPMSTLMAVTAEGDLMRWSKRIDFTAGMSGPEDLVVYMVHAPVATGVVMTPGGAPVPGASIVHKETGATATSDANGHFAMAELPHEDLTSPLRLEDRLLVSKSASSLISIQVPGFDDDMVWQPIEVLMVPSSTMAIEAKTRDGTPLVGLDFQLNLSPDGPFSRNERAVFGYSFDARYGSTDASGTCKFEGVPAGVHLRVTLGGVLEFEALDSDAFLVPNGRPSKAVLRPLAMDPEGETRVIYQPDAYVTLRGIVLEADGTPSVKARLRFDAVDAESTITSLKPDRALTRDDGTFEVPVAITGPTQGIVVRAQSTVGERASYSPFGGTIFPDPLSFAQDTVSVAAPHDLTLHLIPQSKVNGRIVDPGGPHEGYVTVRIVPESDPAPFDFVLGGHLPTTRTISRGSFEFKGVPPGTYRLEARSAEYGLATVSGVAHDATDVVLRFGEPEVAQVLLKVSGPDGISGITVDSAEIQVSRRLEAPRPLAGRSTFSTPLGYDGGALSVSSGSASIRTKGVRGSASVNHYAGSEHGLTLAPGSHWIGVRGTDLGGRAMFPVGTGPVQIGAGTHEIHFHLHGTASLQGQVRSARGDGVERMAELHLLDGTLVPCVGDRAGLQSAFRIASNGQFDVDVLPACPLELWIGTRAELASGRPASVTKIEPSTGESIILEIDL